MRALVPKWRAFAESERQGDTQRSKKFPARRVLFNLRGVEDPVNRLTW